MAPSLTPPSASSYTHAVSRSNELLSCAKTAVKIAQRQHANDEHQQQGAWWTVTLSELRLYDADYSQHAPDEVLEDGLSLLRTMESELKHLESLVRRRGQSNDPTTDISLSVQRLETDTRELGILMKTMIPHTVRSGQRLKHWQHLQQYFQSVAQQQAARLKEILKVRAKVIKEQADRRKRFQTSSTSTKAATTAKQYDNPLFNEPAKRRPVPKPPPPPPPVPAQQTQQQYQPPPLAAPQQQQPQQPRSNGGPPHASMSMSNGAATSKYGNGTLSATPASARSPSTDPQQRQRPPAGRTAAPAAGGYAYYGKGYGTSATTGGYVGVGTAGYGGSAANSSYYTGATGMRQRRSVAASGTTQDATAQQGQMQEQMMVRQQERQSQQRLQEARQAEKSLAELGNVFGKMSTLISQQSEVMDKIEDDVECALFDVTAGQQEITTLYSIKKGNRALIIKVFGILIFFICFMKLYSK